MGNAKLRSSEEKLTEWEMQNYSAPKNSWQNGKCKNTQLRTEMTELHMHNYSEKLIEWETQNYSTQKGNDMRKQNYSAQKGSW